MFRCQFCRAVVPPRTPSQYVVTQVRLARYPARPRAHRVVHVERGKRKVAYLDDPGGSGVAIVRELRACQTCAANRRPAAGVSPSS